METRLTADGGNKVKLICSYGGKIQPRPQTNKLTYIGGDNKLLTVDRNIKFSDIFKKLSSLFNFQNDDVWIKYQLPGEDLDVLISLIDDDDLQNMMIEYDRLHMILSPHNKPVRMRLFLSSRKPNSSEPVSGTPLNPDYLFGFDKDYDYNRATKSTYDLELWKIPCTAQPRKILQNSNLNPSNNNGDEAQKVAALDGHVTVKAAAAYGFPVTSVRLQIGQQQSVLMQGMVKMGMTNGGSGHQPIYNLVPTIPSVPEQMNVAVTAFDMSCRHAKIATNPR